MTGPEIKSKFDANNAKISELFDPKHFVLNAGISILLKENVELQKKCPHEFEDGYCIFCQRKEET